MDRARRTLLTGTLTAAGGVTFRAHAQTQESAGYRIPGEFEPASAIWLSYDQGYGGFTVALIKALIPHVPVKMLTSTPENDQAARELLQSNGIGDERVTFLIEPLSMFFLRDAAVFASGPGRSLGMVDFRWSNYGLPGWCARRHAGKSQLIAQCSEPAKPLRNDLDLAIARSTRAKVISSPLFIEGGGVEVNGRGLIIANRSLFRQRNPAMSVVAIEKHLLALPGIKKVLWVPEGLAEDPHLRATITGRYVGWGTGGHTDEFVRFVDPRTVLLAWPDDDLARSHPVAALNRERMQRCAQVLERATDTEGNPLRVIRVPTPRPIERRIVLSANADTLWSDQWTATYFGPKEGRREGDWVIQVAAASYMNFIIANDGVIVPDYLPHGTPASVQNRVRGALEAAMPGRRITFVNAIDLNWFGGGPHCATLKEPA